MSSEPSMSVCNGHSEEELGQSVMENGDSTIVDRPKLKRRKISAVRDFPEECGPFGSADGTSVEDKRGEDLGGGDSGEADSPNHEKDPQNSELNEDLFVANTVEQTNDCSLKELSDQVNEDALADDEPAEVELVGVEAMDMKFETQDCSLKKEDPVVLSDQVDGDSLANDEPGKMELVGVEAMDMKFETEDCSLKKEDPAVLSDQVDGDSLANDEPAKMELVGVEAMDVKFETEDCSLKKEDLVVSSHQFDVPILDNNLEAKVTLMGMETLDAEFATESCGLENENPVDESTLANDEPAELALVGMETLDMEFATEDSVNQDLSYISKAPSPVGEIAMSDDSKSSLSNINMGGSGACMKEALTRYPPRKKVAAFRDFPHLCGPNAPRLSQDECLKQLSSLNRKRADQQNSSVDVSPLKKVPAADVKEAENNKRKFASTVQGEGNATQRFKKLDVAEQSSEMRWARDNTREKNTILPEKHPSIGGTDERKGKKVDFYAQLDRSKTATKSKGVLNHSGHQLMKKKKENSSSDDMGQLVTWEKNSLDPNENNKHFKSVPKSRGSGVNVFPPGRSNLSGHENDSVSRNKVRKALDLFQTVCRSLLQEADAKPKSNEKERRRFDLQAAKVLKKKGSYVNEGKKILGSVPGVEVGDEFQYRIELNIIGLHHQIQGGIDYVKDRDKILATSIVASGGYADDVDNSDVLIYTGQGGNVMSNDKEPEDQKLERGNLALKNSSEVKNSVRVIRGSESMDGKKIYVYDGLYVVESFWQDVGPHGKLVFKFRLRRIPGQPALKDMKKSKKF